MGREKGGVATATKMTAEERKERAMKGVAAREYKKSLPITKFEGKLKIGDNLLDVAVIEGDTRVIRQQAVFEALNRPGRGTIRKPDIPVFMDASNLQPLVSDELRSVMGKISYVDKNGSIQQGYNATILPLVADLYLKAREQRVLHPTQVDTATKAEILVRTLAKVGITALVDEATGYQDAREKDALAKIFEAFIDNELQPWIKTFPDDYYKELFRLYNLPYPPKNGKVSRPGFFGHVTNKVIYKKLAPEILPELKKQANKLGKNVRLHQTLTPNKGHPDLQKLVTSVTTIMKLSKDKEDFFEKVDRIHPDFTENYVLDLDD